MLYEVITEYGTSEWSVLFSLLLDNPNDYNVTRLDVAYDDKTGIIPIDKMARDVLQHNYVSIFNPETLQVEIGYCN